MFNKNVNTLYVSYNKKNEIHIAILMVIAFEIMARHSFG